jgi:predicted transposase/invertase (TIGR01784 family)
MLKGFLKNNRWGGCLLRSRFITDSLHEQTYASKDLHTKYGSQVFGISTYDALFKWVLDDPTVCPSFLNSFVPGLNVISSERLDDNMNPTKDLQLLRKFVYATDTLEVVQNLKESGGFEVRMKKNNDSNYRKYIRGTEFLNELISHFGDILKGFPSDNYSGKMDFVCRLDSGEYALIETQVIRKTYWDKRALAYLAAFYGKQLRRGGEWQNLKRVIGINILGGGVDLETHWLDSPHEFCRHYRFQEQNYKAQRFIEGMELYQYSLANMDKSNLSEEQKDWLTFLRDSHKMSEEDIKHIKTPAVRRAFERAKLDQLPLSQLMAYDKEYDSLKEYSDVLEHAKAESKAEGKAEAKAEFALRLIQGNLSDEMILNYTNISFEELKQLRQKFR